MSFFFKFSPEKEPEKPVLKYPVSLGTVMISNDITPTSAIRVQVQTAVFTNGGDPLFLEQLSEIGITILAYNNVAATILLPIGWTHIGESATIEHIIDNFGRRRLTTNVTSIEEGIGTTKLLPRFTFCVDRLERDVDNLGTELIFLGIALMDNGKIVEQKEFDAATCKMLLLEVYNNDKNLLYDKVITEAFYAVTQEYPGFDNPINYW